MDATGELYLDLLKKTLTAALYDESGWQIVENATINNQRVNIAPHLVLLQKTPFQAEVREIGRDWPFIGYSMIGHKRLDNIRFCIEDVLKNNIPGDLIETGVWRGGATIWMRGILKAHGVSDRKVWVADSFEGMPVQGPLDKNGYDPDLHNNTYLRVSLPEVQANFKRFGLLDDQVCFVKGWFKDSLPGAPIGKLAVLRVDCDMYESTRDSLQNLYHHVSPGGYVILDDYLDWKGCHDATDDFRRQHNITAEMKAVDRNGAFWQVPRA